MTLAGLERRLAAMHQERTFNPHAPFWVVFNDTERAAWIKPEEAQ